MSSTRHSDSKIPRPRRYALLESLRSVTPFRSPKTPTEAKFRNQPCKPPPGVVVSSKPPFEPRPARPEIDRSVDLVADTGISVDPEEIFALLLRQNGATTVTNSLFALPPAVRRQIYGYCFPVEDRKICLSPRFATKAVWPTGYFASPWKVLEDVMGGLGSSRALRNDIMTYFWAEYQFHVTLTPFSGPVFSPLSHVWMQDYLGIIQKLTVEADLTRFGGSQLVNAPRFGYDVENIEELLVAIVEGILERQDGTPMAEFNLMCRRYIGFRPPLTPPTRKTGLRTSEDTLKAAERTSKSSDGSSNPLEEPLKALGVKLKPKVPYCPDECMFLCDVVSDLWDIVQSSRISGFTLPYTQLLLTAMFGFGNKRPNFKRPDTSPWPTFVPGLVIIPTPKIVSEFEFGLQSTKNQVTTGEIKDKTQELMKVNDKLLLRELSDFIIEDTACKSNAKAKGRYAVTTKNKPGQVESVQPPQCNTPSIVYDILGEGIARSDLTKSGFVQSCLAEIDLAHPSTPEHSLSTSTLREGSGLANLPTSPNTMNRLNEQDPAFCRTLDALRLVDSQSKASTNLPTQSVLRFPEHQPAPVIGDHCNPNLGKPRIADTDKKLPFFMGKIKGMFSK